MPLKHDLFISYSHKDAHMLKRVLESWKLLEQIGLLTVWYDPQIRVGEIWHKSIRDAIAVARIAVLLVSEHYLDSNYILKHELPMLLRQRASGHTKLLPLLLEPCSWQNMPALKEIQIFPRNARPVFHQTEPQINADLAAFAEELCLVLQPEHSSERSDDAVLHPARVSLTQLPITGGPFVGRNMELTLMNYAWQKMTANVLSVVAFGGVGKSALVNHWLNQIAAKGYGDANSVYGWSFYSQGSSNSEVSADQFVLSALRWFGDSDPQSGSPWEKGARLARLVGNDRNIVVLDGLEPLQRPPGPQEGQIKDPAIATFVRALAASNRGLCIITTRLAVPDLQQFASLSAPVMRLDHLSPLAGTELLHQLGVEGTFDECLKAVELVRRHSLALYLLGTYVRDVCGGKISRLPDSFLLMQDQELGGHAFRVIASYEAWFGDSTESDVLRVIGLFDRPVKLDTLKVLGELPGITGLSERLTRLDNVQWMFAISRLQRAGLLAKPNPSQADVIDAHPLVRDYFSCKVRVDSPSAWQQGHDRLFEHLAQEAPEFPNSLEEMAPLLAAIYHGCHAGRHHEAEYEILYCRIRRQGAGYIWKALGAYGADLAAVSNFFDERWSRPTSKLPADDRAVVMNFAGTDLKALGRLSEAAEAYRQAIGAYLNIGNHVEAARNAENLSQTLGYLGRLPESVQSARESVAYASRTANPHSIMDSTSALAIALFLTGHPEAEDAFQQVEVLQRGEFPVLYSLRGYYYCDLLLTKGRYAEVLARARRTLAFTIPAVGRGLGLFDVALDQLSIGRALMHMRRPRDAANYIDQALDSLRRAGTQHHIPRALLARAELRCLLKLYSESREDVETAAEIALTGGMRLFEADCHLMLAKLSVSLGRFSEAQQQVESAAAIVVDTGYSLRQREIERIRREAQRHQDALRPLLRKLLWWR